MKFLKSKFLFFALILLSLNVNCNPVDHKGKNGKSENNKKLKNLVSENQSIVNKSDSIFVFCGTGDHFWDYKKEPVDSKPAITSMLDWLKDSYNTKRIYWRGGQEELMVRNFKFGKETVLHFDYYNWIGKIYKNGELNKFLVQEAKKRGIETFLYTGLFEYGLQPDIGIVNPYLFEDRLRIDNPSWISINRWGNRKSPGMISYSFQSARKSVITRLVNYINEVGFNGVAFYTYLENTGLKYEDEFGFEKPVVDKFNIKYPNVDVKNVALSPEQKNYLDKIKGEFISLFLAELKLSLNKYNKKLSIILDPNNPNLPQPAWGKTLRGTGNIYMDWKNWIEKGSVDELWVQLDKFEKQKVLLDELLKYKNKINIVVRTDNPHASHWKVYKEQGVVIVAVITSIKNGIENYTGKNPNNFKENSNHKWINRASKLEKSIVQKTILDDTNIDQLLNDDNLLVRRKIIQYLGNTNNKIYKTKIEEKLNDKELSVRVMAIGVLPKVGDNSSINKILQLISKDSSFMAKNVAQESLSNFGFNYSKTIIKEIEQSSSPAVREVGIRALGSIGRKQYSIEIVKILKSCLNDSNADYRLRWWSMKGLVAMRLKIPKQEASLVLNDIMNLIKNEKNSTVFLEAVSSLEIMSSFLTREDRLKMISLLTQKFKTYGDNSKENNASFGWRVVGNTLEALGPVGKLNLENFVAQTENKWLAWAAYEVIYLKQIRTAENGGFNEIPELEAIKNQKSKAPNFPGFRRWTPNN